MNVLEILQHKKKFLAVRGNTEYKFCHAMYFVCILTYFPVYYCFLGDNFWKVDYFQHQKLTSMKSASIHEGIPPRMMSDSMMELVLIAVSISLMSISMNTGMSFEGCLLAP